MSLHRRRGGYISSDPLNSILRPMYILIPPLPVTRKRNMHRALFVPEILLIIFKCVTDDSGRPLLPALAVIARTCRTFQRSIEEILWYELPRATALYNILPPHVRNKEFQPWSLSRRMLSGFEWTHFMDRASRVRVLEECTRTPYPHYDGCWTILLAISALRNPPVLTPNLRELKWLANNLSYRHAINIFLSPSLRSLEIDANLLISHVIRSPLGDICPKLLRLKITGNGRSATDTISSAVRGLHCLETVACPTLDNDAFVHLARLKRLSYLAVDMRWSELAFAELLDRLGPGSFQSLQTLYWKDYNLDLLAEIFLMSGISPPNVRLEIESFCTSPSLRAFLHSFAEKFPETRDFSLVHDITANKRFGLHVGPPGREYQLDAHDLKPLFALKSLRALSLVDVGNLQLDDDFVKTIASALPELERLRLGIDATEHTGSSVTFDGLLFLLQHCPKLRSVGLNIDAEGMLSFSDTTVRQEHVTHLRLEGSILGLRRAEVDEMLRRVLPGLKTVEESPDGLRWREREVGARCGEDGVDWAAVKSRPTLGRRTRNSLESARSG